MLVTLSEILKLADAEKCAVGAFNTPSMTSMRAVIDAAQELKQPVIIMHAQVHEEMGLCKMEEIAPVMLLMADRASVPVCVHLDHGEDLEYVSRGLKLGFTSVMYDGSALDAARNAANTRIVVSLAAKCGASVEAEIGSLGARESGEDGGESMYTDPEQAAEFVRGTGIDALACAFGTAHGLYMKEPKLDLERLDRIHELVNVPLVMHGGSGISHDDYKAVIRRGVKKINYYTYMAKAGGEAAAALEDKTFFHDMETAAYEAMKRNVKTAIGVFSRGA